MIGPPNLTEMATTTKQHRSVGKGKGKATAKPSKFYTTGPKAPAKKTTTGKLTQTAPLGDAVPAMVPQNPGRSSGFGGAAHSFPKAPKGGHGYGHDVIKRLGAFRLSGHSGAHRLGGSRKR